MADLQTLEDMAFELMICLRARDVVGKKLLNSLHNLIQKPVNLRTLDIENDGGQHKLLLQEIAELWRQRNRSKSTLESVLDLMQGLHANKVLGLFDYKPGIDKKERPKAIEKLRHLFHFHNRLVGLTGKKDRIGTREKRRNKSKIVRD